MSLTGKRIIVTRPADRAASLLDRLRDAGATAANYPTIVIRPPLDPEPLDAALLALQQHDWIVFTSVAGVEAVFGRFAALELPAADWAGVRIAAVGPATARAIRSACRAPDLVPVTGTGAAIAEALGECAGHTFLFVRGSLSREDARSAVRQRGGEVVEVEAYRTEMRADFDPEAGPLLRACDAITFTSPSTLHGFLHALGPCDWPAHTVVATIGPTTSRAVRDAGLRVHAQAIVHSEDGLVSALQQWFSKETGA